MLPTFSEVFEAIHGSQPFPWQRRLADQVLERGWPALLDLPTGAGKTSALDIALYVLVRAADRMPRRTVLVVDRRIVVDEAAERARKIQRALRTATEGPLAAFADALRALWHPEDRNPFLVSVMRGGMPRDDDWARAPDAPVLGMSTVDQIGSRVFFRGYGLSPRSASIHAGLLGNDTLVLLDEVHLAEPFRQTLAAARALRQPNGLPDRYAVVQMSATPGATKVADTFSIDRSDDHGSDRTHPVLGARLRASKIATLMPVKVTGDDEGKKLETVAEQAVLAARKLQSEGAKVVGIILNRVDGARRAYAQLAGVASTDRILVTGRMRPIDRDVVVRELQRRAGPRDRSASERPLVVVATQCLEAGADLDFDGLVTECASLDALRQRFGRLDRRGDLKTSRAVILGRSDSVGRDDADPIYGDALRATWTWLTTIARGGTVDFGLEALPPAPSVDVLAPRQDAPVLLPGHLDAWAQTSPRPDFDPDLALWLHGPQRPGMDVQVVFRADLVLPEQRDAEATEAIVRLTAARPSSLEALSIPIGAARRWLAGEAAVPIADVVAGDIETSAVERRTEREEPPAVALRWRAEDSAWVRASDIRPGDTLVVPAALGGIRDGSFDPDSKTPVSDVGDLAALRGRAIAQLRLGPACLEPWALPPESAADAPSPKPEQTAQELRTQVRDWATSLPGQRPAASLATDLEWVAFRDALRDRRKLRVAADASGGAVVSVHVEPAQLRDQVEVADAVTEDDDSPFCGVDLSLRQHSSDVRDVARRFANGLGLPEPLAKDLALAAWLHDVGKADDRFQRWLVGGSEVAAAALDEPLAKSRFPKASPTERRAAQARAGYPTGYRHELLSVAMASSSHAALAGAHDRDLVLHLVASHHGYARPFAPFEDHPEDIAVTLPHGEVELTATTRHRLARLGSEMPERFFALQDRYGWWGLAWLEAVLRLADHRASREREEGRAP